MYVKFKGRQGKVQGDGVPDNPQKVLSGVSVVERN